MRYPSASLRAVQRPGLYRSVVHSTAQRRYSPAGLLFESIVASGNLFVNSPGHKHCHNVLFHEARRLFLTRHCSQHYAAIHSDGFTVKYKLHSVKRVFPAGAVWCRTVLSNLSNMWSPLNGKVFRHAAVNSFKPISIRKRELRKLHMLMASRPVAFDGEQPTA
jgi:hypothetical protein